MNQLTISAIVPARDEEANITRAVESLAGQPEVLEVIVVNDQSTDGTGAILSELQVRVPKLRVLETHELPAGWVGKNRAAATGAGVARSEWLLFTDADTEHLPGSVARALADAEAHGSAMVSYSPEQEMRSAFERALIPFIYCRLAEKFPFARVNNAALPDAAANGQYLLVCRDAYAAIGGHAAVAGEVLEDVALARRLKSAGYEIYFSSGQGIARTRMYRSFRDMWQGWTKNLFFLLGGSGKAIAKELFAVVPWLALMLLFVGALERSRRIGPALLAFGLLLLAGRHGVYATELRRNRYPARLIVYYVPAVLLYAAALATSAWKNTRGTIVWKGREYPARIR
jgi:glycosyltransferase involved in cell wall biosynthesis